MASKAVAELDDLAARTRRDTGMEAVTLFTAGALSCLTIGVNGVAGGVGGFEADLLHGLGNMVLAPLIPIALLGVWLYLRGRESRRGVGRQSRIVGWTAVGAAVLLAGTGLGYVATLILGPYPAVMGLVALAGVRFSSRPLVGWGLVAGGVGLFVGMFQFNNRFGLPWLDDAVGIAIAGATLAAGITLAMRGRRA